jgi:hypothetical protein
MPIDDAMALVKSKAGIQFDPEIVSLLEERYPELEKLARQQTSEMEPLKTNIFVERGAAPGAGFEVDPATVVAPGIATTPTVNVADPVLAGLSAS